jgi:hypothetical protein
MTPSTLRSLYALKPSSDGHTLHAARFLTGCTIADLARACRMDRFTVRHRINTRWKTTCQPQPQTKERK